MTDAYPLAALLALREREEEAARAALAAALAGEDRARRERDTRRVSRDELARRASAGGARPRERESGATLQAAAGYAERLRRELAAAHAALATAEEALAAAGEGVAAARAGLAEASAAREAIARHRAAWEDSRRLARERAEEAAQDDLAAARARER